MSTKSWIFSSLLALTLLAPRLAQATVVERVVAVVGERAILLSDLRERARPMLVRVYEEVPEGAKRSAAISQIYKSVLERIVDEELQQRAANQSRIVVSAREVDDAIGRVAAQNGITVEQLVGEARRAGLSEEQYRNEIRRQVLEAKLLNLRVQGRIRVTEEDMKNAYRRLVQEDRRRLPFRAAWIRVTVPADKAGAARARQEAEGVARSARLGDDFAALARRHSDDTATRERGGLLGRLLPGQLPRPVDQVAMTLEVGDVSQPVRFANAYYVVKLIERAESELPTFREARGELAERMYLEKMNKARQHWLDNLRRRTHVEVRL